jgi:DNA polymerase-1
MVASYLIDASRSSHSLDSLALALLGRTNISISELIGSGKEQRTFDTVPIDQATQYAAEDADVALQLRNIMLPQLKAMELLPLFRDVEMPLVEVLAELEWNGILVDPKELDRQRERIQKG